MTYLSTGSLSKSYGLKVLFEDLTFRIAKGDKTALVAPNGTGKSTLLRMLAGLDTPDSGEVMIRNGVRTGYLDQNPALPEDLTIKEFMATGDAGLMEIALNYEEAIKKQAKNYNEETQRAFEQASAAMDAANAWDYEQRLSQILGKLDIHDLDRKLAELSGGERKRVALAFVLLGEPDLIILDEPTNHLDLDMIEWLEEWLSKPGVTLFMVTHDRYFLDRVCSHILELDEGKLYHHKGNYAYYLEKKLERKQIEQVDKGKAVQLYKKELEWMRRGPKARTTKAKSRIDAFYDIKEKATSGKQDSEIRLEVQMSRMGNQILEVSNISKSYGDLEIIKKFNYTFSKGERIGIIGKNGTGKSTLLNMLTGSLEPDSGSIVTGQTIVFGYYQQHGLEFKTGQRVIDIIKEVAEVVVTADGSTVSASKFLEFFMFPPQLQYTPVENLSGGEKRRLSLMMTLIKNPNFLILDEPTNDLDLDTLARLESFLSDFGGCLLIVSHDRFFMDKLVEHYFVLEGDGRVRGFHGSYSEYRKAREEELKQSTERKTPEVKKESHPQKETKKTAKLSYKEQKEYEALEEEIPHLEEQKEALEAEMSSGALDHEALYEKSMAYQALEKEIEEKTTRWLELAERV